MPLCLCDRPREPQRLFMVQQTHNRKEIRQREKHRRSFLHSSTPLCLPICPHKALPKASSLPFYGRGRGWDGGVCGRPGTCALLHQNGRERLLKRTCRWLRRREDPLLRVFWGRSFNEQLVDAKSSCFASTSWMILVKSLNCLIGSMQIPSVVLSLALPPWRQGYEKQCFVILKAEAKFHWTYGGS